MVTLNVMPKSKFVHKIYVREEIFAERTKTDANDGDAGVTQVTHIGRLTQKWIVRLFALCILHDLCLLHCELFGKCNFTLCD